MIDWRGRWAAWLALSVAVCPAGARAGTIYGDLLYAGGAARLSRSLARQPIVPPRRLPFLSSLSAVDRFDLNSFRSHSVTAAIGPVDLTLTANRATSLLRSDGFSTGGDRWGSKGVGIEASLPLADDIGLALDAEYARMTRRLRMIETTPYRLGTSLAKIGAALDFATVGRLALDYLSVARSSGHDDLTRLAETIGGAPLTGRGPELSFTSGDDNMRGATSWRFSLASMQRPERDLGLVGSSAMRSDNRATISLTMHL